jgi:7,8-dihydropterin-6-yl-methyl-4-(beta-D-ribofuranosyl)aminobenzene 5'-phosphate synthase
MIVKVLIEDTCQNPALAPEHGLSLHIEANGRKILFDTGQSPAFLQNAEKMGVDLSLVDFAVLSHAHYDHGGGIAAFLSHNDRAKVYVSRYAFGDYLAGADRYVGLDPLLKDHPRLLSVSEITRLADGISVYPAKGQTLVHPILSYGLTIRRNGALLPDDFRHEQYLEIVEAGKRVLVSGCSHRGIVNIARWFRPDVLVGGFHLFNLDPEGEGRAELDAVARELNETGAFYYTCHCTGVKQYEYLKRSLKDRLFYISSGQEITV